MKELQVLLDSIGVKLEAQLVGYVSTGDWKHFAWTVTLTRDFDDRDNFSHTTTIKLGVASFKPMPRHFKPDDHDKVRAEAWKRDPRAPLAPTSATVVECLFSDASSVYESFDDWCDSLGFSNDSIKALTTYLDCQRSAKALRRLLGEHYSAVAEKARES